MTQPNYSKMNEDITPSKDEALEESKVNQNITPSLKEEKNSYQNEVLSPKKSTNNINSNQK